MKKDFAEVAKKTMLKKTGWKLLLMLAAFIGSAVMPAVSSAEWTIGRIDTAKPFDDLYQRAMAIDSYNHPHIAYGGDNLYHTYFDGFQWQDELVDNALDVGAYASIAIGSNDNVHISYYDGVNGDLKYATNSSGSWVIETVDTEGDVGGYTSIAIDSSDNLHIGYYDYTNGALKYAMNVSGSWVVETIDAQGGVGQYSSLAVDSNKKVHISYFDEINSALKYATNSSGSWVIETLDSEDDVGWETSIAIDSNNNVHISYHNRTTRDLKYVTNTSGLWVIETVATEGEYGPYWILRKFASIAIDSNDKVHISYRIATTQFLMYATNVSGSWVKRILDYGFNSHTYVGKYNSIAIDSNDKVHIGYHSYSGYNDETNSKLKYATNVLNLQSVLAEDAYNVLITDPAAVMFDVRTAKEHNGYCQQPWDCDWIETDAAYAGTPQWAVNGSVYKLPINLPYVPTVERPYSPPGLGYDIIVRSLGPPRDEAQIRNIIEGALAANIIDFDTPIYFIGRTAYRSYYMIAWMNTQAFTNLATGETSSFTNMFNIDADDSPINGQGGMQEWIAAGLPIFDGTIVPPQILSGYPEDGDIETSTNDVIFVAGVLELTNTSFIYPDVTEVLLYVDGNSPVPMTQVDEAALRAFFGIPDDVLLPGKVYMATQYLPDGVHTWNVSATNIAGTSWNFNVLGGAVQGPDGPGQRTLTVDTCSPSGDDTDCNGRDDDCDGIPDNNYVSTPTNCGVGICESTGTLECVNGSEVDSCVESTPETEGPTGATCSDNLDNDCDGATDLADPSCVLICTDNDGDGYAVEGGDCGEVDCNDSNANVNPGAVEVCDGLDNNCDGSADEGFDADGDGYTTCGGDCDDTNSDINLGSTEGPAGDPTCSDGLDNDCDGAIDNADSGCAADDGGGRPTRRRSGRRGGHSR